MAAGYDTQRTSPAVSRRPISGNDAVVKQILRNIIPSQEKSATIELIQNA